MASSAILAIRLVVTNAAQSAAQLKTFADQVGKFGAAVDKAAKPAALVGLAGQVAAALAPVGVAFTAAAAGVGAFGAAVGPQVKAMGEVAQAATKLADAQATAANKKATADRLAASGSSLAGKAAKAAASAALAAQQAQDAYTRATLGMPAATVAAAIAFGKLKSAYQSWSDGLSGTTMPLVTTGIEALTAALPALTPLVKATAAALAPFLASFSNAVKSGGLLRFTTLLAQIAGPVLSGLLLAIRGFGVGVGAIFAPLAENAQSFGDALGRAGTAFASFMQQANLSQFAQLSSSSGDSLVQLGEAALHLMVALGPLIGTTTLLANAFSAVILATPTPVIQVLGPLLIGLSLTVKAVQAATVLWGVATAVATGATAANTAACNGNSVALAVYIVRCTAARVASIAMAAASGVVRVATIAWTAAQWLLNAALTANPIGLVVLAVAALAAGLYVAYTKSTTFRNIVQAAFRAVANAAGWVADAVKTVVSWFSRVVLPGALSTITGAFHTMMGAINDVIGAVKSLIDWLSKISTGALSKVSGLLGKLNPFSAAAPPPGQQRARAFGAASYAAGAPFDLNRALAANVHVTVNLDGQPFRSMVARTVNRALDTDGARLAARGWA